MEFQDIVKELENTQEFRDWNLEHPDAYLAHIFIMMDEANKGFYQVGYYDLNTDSISTFVVGKGTVEVIPDQEVAKTGGVVNPLDISQVKNTTKEITESADKVRQENYGKLPFIKAFFVIQSLDDSQIYNVTYLTQDFKTINVKLDMALTVISHDCKALADFTTGEK